jgi:hypothetical protein
MRFLLYRINGERRIGKIFASSMHYKDIASQGRCAAAPSGGVFLSRKAIFSAVDRSGMSSSF